MNCWIILLLLLCGSCNTGCNMCSGCGNQGNQGSQNGGCGCGNRRPDRRPDFDSKPEPPCGMPPLRADFAYNYEEKCDCND